MNYYKELEFRYYKKDKEYRLEDKSGESVATIRYISTMLSKQKSSFKFDNQRYSIRSESIWKIRAGVYRLGVGDEEEQIAEIRYDIWRSRMELFFESEGRKYYLRQKGFMRFRYELEDVETKQKIAIIRPMFKFSKMAYSYIAELHRTIDQREPKIIILLMTSFFGARQLLDRSSAS